MEIVNDMTAGKKRFGMRLIFGLALILAALLPLTVEASVKRDAGELACNVETDPADLPPEVLAGKLEDEFCATGSWFVRERDDLLRFALGSGVSVLVGALLLWLFHRRLRRVPRGKNVNWRTEVLKALTAPFIVLAVFVSCAFFFEPVWKALPRNVGKLDMHVFYASVMLIVAWGLISVLSVMDRRIRRFAEREDNSLDGLTVGMVGTTIKIAVAVAVLLFVGQNIFNLNITALLAGAGVVGLAVALAAKDTISNFFGTLVIVADAPFRLGDRIRAGEIDGVVLRVGMRSSKILTEDESVCTVPNSVLTNTAVCNLSRRGYMKHSLEIGLTYDTSPDRMALAMKILHEIMDDFHGPDAPDYAPHIFFSGFSASSVNIRAMIWFKTGSFREEERLLDELNMEIFRRFSAAGLEFAYPTQTVYFENVSPDCRH